MLETAYSRPFLGSFGAYFPHMTSSIVETPKRTLLGRKYVVWAFSVRIGATVRPGSVMKEKIQDKKNHKSVIFPLFVGSPHWTDSTQKWRGGWFPRHNHVCQVSNWNLHGLRFYRRSNFRFSYWLLHGPYNSAALLRCLWLFFIRLVTFVRLCGWLNYCVTYDLFFCGILIYF